MKLDLLVFAAHPDDAELACSGTIMRMIALGHKVGVIDLTAGELGTRGTVEIRAQESAASSAIMGLHVRENLGMRDGFFQLDETHKLEIIRAIRRYQPEVLLINAPTDRHPDHGRGSELVRDAAFLSGLRRIETEDGGNAQVAWRPKKVWRYIQDQLLMPSFVVDITDHFDQKIAAIRAFTSQFYDPNSKEPETYISSSNFLDVIKARCQEMGHLIGVRYGEGFIAERPLRVDDLLNHL
jgi:bacillithiol biosynthesis deacetylase BshB1